MKDYIPYLDTLNTAFKFLSQQGLAGTVKDALSKVESFNGRFQQIGDIKQFIRERKEQLKQQLENLGRVKELKKFNKQAFYYAEQIKEYKEILKDPKKIEKRAIELLSKTELFQDFMKKNSMLASLFGMPGDPNDPSSQATSCASNINAGIYTISITDGNGCSVTGVANVNDITAPVVTIPTSANVTCAGAANGSAQSSAVGGIIPYSIVWTPTGQTTAFISGLSGGIYSVTYTDALPIHPIESV